MSPDDAALPRVRPAQVTDLAVTASLHARGLPDGFFARLGETFLRGYHDSFRTSPYAVLAVTEGPDGVPTGFAAAALDARAHARWVLRRHGRQLLMLAAYGLLVRPSVLVLFVRTRLVRYARGLWRRLRPAAATGGGSSGTTAVLSHIAVDPSHRRGGHGAALVAVVRAAAADAGAGGVVVLTDPEGPGPDFYRRLGFRDTGLVRGADRGVWRRFTLPLP